MTIVIAGDLHLYYEGTNVDAVDEFVERVLAAPPEALVLGGDIYELWRRDLSGATWMTSDFTRAMLDLRDRGTEVVYIAGNHDDNLLRHLRNDPRYPFDPVVDHRVSTPEVDLFITHGHKYELPYNPIANDALSLTDDHAGRIAGDLWEHRPLPQNPVEQAGLLLLGPAASFLDPENVSKNALRRRVIERGIRMETSPAEWGIFGHTHVPYVDMEDRIANWGSMTGGKRTYIEVERGEVLLREV